MRLVRQPKRGLSIHRQERKSIGPYPYMLQLLCKRPRSTLCRRCAACMRRLDSFRANQPDLPVPGGRLRRHHFQRASRSEQSWDYQYLGQHGDCSDFHRESLAAAVRGALPLAHENEDQHRECERELQPAHFLSGHDSRVRLPHRTNNLFYLDT